MTDVMPLIRADLLKLAEAEKSLKEARERALAAFDLLIFLA